MKAGVPAAALTSGGASGSGGAGSASGHRKEHNAPG